MTNEIIDQIEELEKKKNIKILLAVESGSRAWGFPSPDSDYDVRIIYIHHPDWYLSINDKKDTVDYFHGELLDISGWELRKTLRLLKKSNATPFEWAQSPIIYKEEKKFRQDLLDLSNQFFQPYHTINHYKGIAKNSYLKNDFNNEIKLKKLFYVLRPLFSIQWIIKNQTVPPMNIFDLMKVIDDSSIKKKVVELIKFKETANEDYVYQVEPIIHDYIKSSFEEIENLNFKYQKGIFDIDILNKFFRGLLNTYY